MIYRENILILVGNLNFHIYFIFTITYDVIGFHHPLKRFCKN